MTQPRRVLAGQTHSVVRRVAHGEFLLRPCEFVTNAIRYRLAIACQKNPDLLVHGWCSLSNHQHGNVTDAVEEGEPSQLGDWMRDVHGPLAIALNVYYDRTENLWRDGSFFNNECHGEPSIVTQLLYTWLQPVAAGLVKWPDEWGGFMIRPEDFGKIIFAKKPKGAVFGGTRRPPPSDPDAKAAWLAKLNADERKALAAVDRRVREKGQTKKRFDTIKREAKFKIKSEFADRRNPPAPSTSQSKLPEVASFRVSVPPGFEDMPIEEVRAYFRDLLDKATKKLHEAMRLEGKLRFKGMQAVREQDPRYRAPDPGEPGALRAVIGFKGEKKHRDNLVRALNAWRQSYRDAWRRYKAKEEDVVFPAGTNRMRLHARVLAASELPHCHLRE